jgi:uncharacterized protein
MDRKPATITDFIVKVTQRCNLDCIYCYMYKHVDNSFMRKPAIMSFNVWETLLHRIVEYSSELPPGYRATLAFHGGEPILLGPGNLSTFLASAVEELGTVLGGLAIQTNAILVTTDILTLLSKYNVKVGVSLDGPPELHDRLRVYRSGAGSYEKTVAGLKRIVDFGLRPTVLCVVDPKTSGTKVYQHLRKLGIDSMDFLLPDLSHDTRRGITFSSETPVADYLIPIFDEWINEDNPDISIRIFEKILLRILANRQNNAGSPHYLQNYLIVDTDGTIHLDDVLKVCDHNLSYSGLNVVDNKLSEWHKARPLFRKVLNDELPLCTTCVGCSEVQVCDGWFLPHRYSKRRGFNNPAVWCKDLLRLIQHIRARTSHECVRCT